MSELYELLYSALKGVPDPEVEGFCEGCGGRPELVQVQVKDYTAYVYTHEEHCWFGKVQRAIAKYEKI